MGKYDFGMDSAYCTPNWACSCSAEACPLATVGIALVVAAAAQTAFLDSSPTELAVHMSKEDIAVDKVSLSDMMATCEEMVGM